LPSLQFIREYQTDVLDYPLAAVLRRTLIGDMASEQGDLKAATVIPTAAAMFPILKVTREAPPVVAGSSVSKKAGEGGDKDNDGCAESKAQEKGEAELADKEDEEEDEEYDPLAQRVDCAEDFLNSASLASSAAYIPPIPASLQLTTSNTTSNTTSFAAQYPKLARSALLCRKMDGYLRSALVIRDAKAEAKLLGGVSGRGKKGKGDARFGFRAAVAAEEMCDELFERIDR
jgi:hypothetical protein